MITTAAIGASIYRIYCSYLIDCFDTCRRRSSGVQRPNDAASLSLSVNVFDLLDMYVARHGHYRCLITKLARAVIITALLYATDNALHPHYYKSTIVVLLFYPSFISFSRHP